MKKEKMDVVFLLDRSGSMHGMEEDTIGGYNSYLDKVKDKNAYITTVLFSDNYDMITERTPIKDVKKLTKETYNVRGCTALLDAIGKTINYIDSKKSNKVLFVITTDGLENASTEYDHKKIQKLIKKHSDWEFIYLGADIDSYKEASSIGIAKNRTSNYKKDKKGTSKMFSCLSKITEEYDCEGTINDSWKEELEDYINQKVS